MIRTLTLVFTSCAVGALIGFGLTYLAVINSVDTVDIHTTSTCQPAWGGNVTP